MAAAVQAIWDGMKNQVDTFLMIQSANKGNYGAEMFAKPQTITEGLFVSIFVIAGLDGITFGDVGVGFGIPDLVIEAVEDAAEFSTVDTQDALQAHAEMAVADFVGVTGRNGGDKIGIDDAAFYQVDCTVAMIISKAVVSDNMGRAQTNLAQDVFTVNALVAEVVKREADARVAQAEMLVSFVKEYRHERGLPVMTMDDFGMLV